jgi:hypothetical protein
VADQVGWLAEAGFDVTVVWEEGDLAVIVGLAPLLSSRVQ